ncbi:MAG: hypothetical protein ACJ75H_20380 [Thermoanaerobaculia bacterium]
MFGSRKGNARVTLPPRQAVPASAVAGDRYASHAMAQLDSER